MNFSCLGTDLCSPFKKDMRRDDYDEEGLRPLEAKPASFRKDMYGDEYWEYVNEVSFPR